MKLIVINSNKKRRNYFEHVFRNMKDNVIYTDGINTKEDYRFKEYHEDVGSSIVMYAHLDALEKYLETDDECAIICEDDILIRRTFEEDIHRIRNTFLERKYDILLLGYITYSKPNSESEYKYYYYGDSQWGTQMYMISRAHAEFIVNEFKGKNSTIGTVFRNTYFSADWTITKHGKRLLIYPMLALEFTDKRYADPCQQRTRDRMRELYYDPSKFITLEEAKE